VHRRLDWTAAFRYMTREPGWRRALFVGGIFLLVMPPIGWVMALGFRSLTGERLTRRLTPALPAWRGNLDDIFLRGAKSSGVILGYLSPTLLLFFALGAGSAAAMVAHAREIVSALLASALFPPVVIPALPVLAYVRWPWFHLTPAEMALLAIMCGATILLLPSAFLRVAATGRYAAAFEVRVAARFALGNIGPYAEAWILSLTVSAAAVLLIPLTPWLLFWSYLVILHAFLQVLWRAGADRPVR
jgi:hypothetical protein